MDQGSNISISNSSYVQVGNNNTQIVTTQNCQNGEVRDDVSHDDIVRANGSTSNSRRVSPMSRASRDDWVHLTVPSSVMGMQILLWDHGDMHNNDRFLLIHGLIPHMEDKTAHQVLCQVTLQLHRRM